MIESSVDHASRERAARALSLYAARSGEIREIDSDLFEVPSESVEDRYYVVDLEASSCECLDHEHHPSFASMCKHQVAALIYRAKRRSRRPEVAAGDPFFAVGRRGCTRCFNGWVNIGIEEDGQEYDEAVPCHRCQLR